MLVFLALSEIGVRAQMSDEEKKRLFLQAREDIKPVPKASPSATPRPKPQPAPSAKPKATPRPTANDEEEEPDPPPRPKPTATPSPRPKATPDETPRPTPRPTPEEEEPKPDRKKPAFGDPSDVIDIPTGPVVPETDEKPAPEPNRKPEPAKPSATPTPTPPQIPPGKTPEGRKIDAPISIEKSGLEADQGYEPPTRQGFGGLFKRWRYLTPATRKAIDQAKVRRGRWKYVIIHNSGTRQGNARVFDVYHRRVRKMQNGLAYHFVIGNGRSSGDGEIEIGNRWTKQINGGHVASDYLNDISIGICLVGDLNRDQPTKAQLAALDELITYLRGRVGKVKGKQAIVKGHKQINPKPTDCPGDRFPLKWLNQRFR